MLGKNFIYDGVSIPYTTAEGVANGWIADFQWADVLTLSTQVPRQDFHGSVANPTYSEGRLISVSGEIYSASKATRGSVRDTVKNLFLIESFPVRDGEFKKLEFTDDDGSEWFINAKVFSMPTYENDRAEPVIRFGLNLFAEDPLIRSKLLQSESGIYGVWGGMTLPITLPEALDDAINEISVTNTGNFASPALITITGEVENPKIFNLTTGRFMEFNITMTPGDVLIIDTENVTAELNGVNILADRAVGSNWLFVNSGTNFFVLTGDDFDYDDQSKATIQVQWYHTNL